jgi:hypothetical protein
MVMKSGKMQNPPNRNTTQEMKIVPKFRILDVQHQDMIRAYLQELSIITDRKPNRTEEYGHGPLKWAAIDVITWAADQNYVFYNPRKLPITPKMIALRIKAYYSGERVMNNSYKDALWIANQMRMQMKGIATKAQPKAWYVDKEIDTAFVEKIAKQDADDGVSDAHSNNNGNGDISELVSLAHMFREYTITNDAELSAIVTNAEVSVLRLLVDRLEN